MEWQARHYLKIGVGVESSSGKTIINLGEGRWFSGPSNVPLLGDSDVARCRTVPLYLIVVRYGRLTSDRIASPLPSALSSSFRQKAPSGLFCLIAKKAIFW